jgi:hypothetical protein
MAKKRKHPKVRTIRAHEVEALLKRTEGRLPSEDAEALRDLVEVWSHFSLKDIPEETTPAELRGKIFLDDETEAP